jgi:hypothetical protein
MKLTPQMPSFEIVDIYRHCCVLQHVGYLVLFYLNNTVKKELEGVFRAFGVPRQFFMQNYSW